MRRAYSSTGTRAGAGMPHSVAPLAFSSLCLAILEVLAVGLEGGDEVKLRLALARPRPYSPAVHHQPGAVQPPDYA